MKQRQSHDRSGRRRMRRIATLAAAALPVMSLLLSGANAVELDPKIIGFKLPTDYLHIARIFAVTSICVAAFAAAAPGCAPGHVRCSNSRATGTGMKRVRSAWT
jgi:hypothetical protein